jgi:hypothetical protein
MGLFEFVGEDVAVNPRDISRSSTMGGKANISLMQNVIRDYQNAQSSGKKIQKEIIFPPPHGKYFYFVTQIFPRKTIFF